MDTTYAYDDDLDCSDSDVECADTSSEDEIDIMLHGTPEQKRKLCKKTSGDASSSEDEFEKEMNQIQNEKVEALEAERGRLRSENKPGTSAPNEKTGTKTASNADKFYDDIYFDSDEEEMVKEGEKREKMRQKVISNDDLLYDPNMDDEDEKWVESERMKYLPREMEADIKKTAKNKNTRRLPNSDAILNCPACMTELCLDCQRHSTYQNQYRAMFVKNCSVDYDENLSYPCEKSKKKKRRKNQHNKGENDSSNSVNLDDSYHPVKCTECNTTVAVFDREEIYHFFNILASYT